MTETLVVGSMATNCYITEGIIVDPGDDAEHIASHVKNPTLIIATHGHFDHIMAAFALQHTFHIPFMMHKDDAFLLPRMQQSAKHFLGLKDVDPAPAVDRFIGDGEQVGHLTVMHTPGHTPGSICLVGDMEIFTGDTLFAQGAVGRTDFAYSDPTKLSQSLEAILSRAKGLRMLPGHGQEAVV